VERSAEPSSKVVPAAAAAKLPVQTEPVSAQGAQQVAFIRNFLRAFCMICMRSVYAALCV
jgi:hypothetical protein